MPRAPLLSNSLNILRGVCYRLPNQSVQESSDSLSDLELSLDNIFAAATVYNSFILLFCDFNDACTSVALRGPRRPRDRGWGGGAGLKDPPRAQPPERSSCRNLLARSPNKLFAGGGCENSRYTTDAHDGKVTMLGAKLKK